MISIENNSKNFDKVVNALRSGKVIAHPADTCFGLAADLMNTESLKKLQAIKGRDGNKPMSIMLPSYLKPRIDDYVICNDFCHFVCDKLLPGPVTLILPKGPKIPNYFFPGLDTVGIRIPYDTTTDNILLKFQGPIITTSANLSGTPPLATYDDVYELFKDKEYQPDLILNGTINGECMPSTVIKLENDQINIIREGPIKKNQLEALLGVKIK